MQDVNKQLLDAASWVVTIFTDDSLSHERGNDEWLDDLKSAIAAAEQAQQAEPVAEIERIVKKLRYYGEVTDGRIDNPERKLMREAADMLAAQPPAVAVPGATDDELEDMAHRHGVHWDGYHWIIEDADFHPFMRAMLSAQTTSKGQQK